MLQRASRQHETPRGDLDATVKAATYHHRRAAKVCTECVAPADGSLCDGCAKLRNAGIRMTRDERKRRGLCAKCGRRRLRPGCVECAARATLRNAAYRRRYWA